jgi:polyhydroxyalkanoate synthesis regulator phasin
MGTTEAAKLAEQIAEIEALVEAGTLTEEEGDARVKELTESFEQRMESFGESMEAWGEEFGEKMETWGEEFSKKWEDRAEELEKSIESGVTADIEIRDLDEEESDSLSIPLPKKKSNKTQFNNFQFHLGANSFRTINGNSTSTEDLLNHYESLTFRSKFNVKNKIGGAGSPLLFSFGYEWEGLAFSFKNDNTIVKVDQPSGEATTAIVPVTGVTDIRRNSFSQAFFTIPMMIELDFSPRGKIDKALNLGFGGYAGVRLGSQNILLGSDSEGDRIRINTNNNYNTHLFRYGLQGQVGIKSWKVTGRIDARTFFQENAFNEDVYVGSITLGYAF